MQWGIGLDSRGQSRKGKPMDIDWENFEMSGAIEQELRSRGPGHVLVQTYETEGGNDPGFSVTIRRKSEILPIPEHRILKTYEDLPAPKFFIPHLPDDPEAAEEEWASYVSHSSADADSKRIYSMTYEHKRSKFVVTVGKPRFEYKRQTGPRGGHIKNADYVRHGAETGTVVSAIIDSGDLIFVWSYGPPFGGWANPSLVGRNETRGIEYFDGP